MFADVTYFLCLDVQIVFFFLSPFREGSKDSEGEGARHLQREEGNSDV